MGTTSPVCEEKSSRSALLMAMSLALAAIPLIRLLHFLIVNGSNNPSNDDLDLMPLLDQVLKGDYRWLNFFRDSFYTVSGRPSTLGHSDAFPIFLQVVLAWIYPSQMYVATLFIGVGLALARIGLLFDAFTWRMRRPYRWLLLPLLAFLELSPTQISTYEFGYASIEQGLFKLGLALGIWGMVRFPGRWKGMAWMVLGGFLGTWSWGGGPLVWPVFLLGMFLLGFRKLGYFLAWGAAALLASLPYAYFLIFSPASSDPTLLSFVKSYLNLELVLQSIGWPFSQGLPASQAFLRGWVGLAFVLVGLSLLSARVKKTGLAPAAPSLLLIAFALLNIYQISVFRGTLLAWYTSPFMLLWIGLLGLAYFLFASRPFQGLEPKLRNAWCLLLLACLGFFYFSAGVGFESHSFYMKSRSPVSASCLKNYRVAPTYCESALFLWDLGQPRLITELAVPLERHGLSVFANRQKWTLQGDFILNNVEVRKDPGAPAPSWTEDAGVSARPFRDFRTLDLALPGNSAVGWTVTLPKNLKTGRFVSAVILGKGLPQAPAGSPFEIKIFQDEVEPRTAFRQAASKEHWQEVEIPLESYAGQTITLALQGPGVFRHPHLALDLTAGPSGGMETENLALPMNTDLSPEMPMPGSDKLTLDVTNPEIWDFRGMESLELDMGRSSTWKVASDPSMTYVPTLGECLGEYSHFYVRFALAKDLPKRVLQFFLKLNGEQEFLERNSANIPLLEDDDMHTYTFDLRLMGLPEGARLTGFRVDPVVAGDGTDRSRIKIMDVGLIRSASPSKCL